MKRKFQKIAVILVGCSLLTGNVTANAAYQSSDEIKLSIRAMNGGIIPEENVHQIYVSPEEATIGTTLHFGIFFETDPAIADISAVNVVMECEGASSVEDTFHSPSSYAYSSAQEFTHTDGNIYSSKFKPYCFGRINMGRYEHGSTFCTSNVQEHLFNFMWMYDLNNQDENGKKLFTAKFFGDASDSYSFIEFDMEIAPHTFGGTYPVHFVTDENLITAQTYITSDDSYPDEANPGKYISDYYYLIPALQDAEIIVESECRLEQPVVAFRNAEDTNAFSLKDFPEEITILENGGNRNLKTEELVDIFETGSPSDISINEPVKVLQSELSLNGVPVLDSSGNPAVLEYRIAKKGDANLDGAVNAKDAAAVLVYASDKGAGNQAFLTEKHDETEEKLAYSIADIDGEGKEDSPLNAKDAAKILVYAAMQGSGQNPDWSQIS